MRKPEQRIVCILLAILLFTSSGYSQSRIVLSGRVIDSSGNGLVGATVRLIGVRDSLQAVSTDHGNFHFLITASGVFTLVVSMKGYQPWRKSFTSGLGMTSWPLAPVILQPDYQELTPVIVGLVRPITIRQDTVVYSARAYTMREGSMLEDLVQRLPGLTLNSDSGLMAMGIKVKRVLLDGKPFYNGDVETALRNLPYDIIDRVELIDDFGDRARFSGVKTGEPEKVLNIVLRKDKSNGISGNIEAGGGNSDQYVSTGVLNAFHGDRKLALIAAANNNSSYGNDYTTFSSLSHTDQWGPDWSGSGDGSYSTDDHTFLTSTIQDSYTDFSHLHLVQDNTSQVNSNAYQANYETIYNNSPRNHLQLNAGVNDKQTGETDQVLLNSNETDSNFAKATQSDATNRLTTHDTKLESRIYFEQVLPHSEQRFTLQSNVQYKDSRQTGDYLTATSVNANSTVTDSTQHYRLNTDIHAWDLNAAVHYYVPTASGQFLEAAYGIHYIPTLSNRSTLAPANIDGRWAMIDSLSNDYQLNAVTQDATLGWSAHGKRTDLRITLTAEPGVLQGQSPGKENPVTDRYFNLLPAGSFTYSYTSTNKILFDYLSTVTLPTLSQIQPITDLSNPEYPVTGNPALKPAVNRTFSIEYEYKSLSPAHYAGFGGALFYTHITAAITTDIIYPQGAGIIVQHTYYQNEEGNYVMGLKAHFDLPALCHDRLKISGWSQLNEMHSTSLLNTSAFTSNTITYSQSLSFLYNIPKYFDLKFAGSYNYSSLLYTAGSIPSVQSTAVRLRLENKYYFFQRWILNYILVQQFDRSSGSRLQVIPLYLYGSIGRSFLSGNQLTASLAVSNILNASSGYSQTTSPNNIVQTYSNLVGRVYILKLQWQFERFKEVHLFR